MVRNIIIKFLTIMFCPICLFGQGNYMFNQHTKYEIPEDTIIFSMVVNNPCNDSPWDIEHITNIPGYDVYVIKYTIEDSQNCGGTCQYTQSGELVAVLTYTLSKNLYLDFHGIGEEQDMNYEKITFFLNNELLAEGHAPGSIGGGTCLMGEVIPKYYVPMPMLVNGNTVNEFRINFSTVDNNFHVGAYYTVTLTIEH